MEDDPQLGFVVQDGLEQNGFEVLHCLNGEIAFNAFLEKEFQIVLLDVMMPQMDGFTLASKIRETDAHIPIIILYRKGHAETRSLVLQQVQTIILLSRSPWKNFCFVFRCF